MLCTIVSGKGSPFKRRGWGNNRQQAERGEVVN